MRQFVRQACRLCHVIDMKANNKQHVVYDDMDVLNGRCQLTTEIRFDFKMRPF